MMRRMTDQDYPELHEIFTKAEGLDIPLHEFRKMMNKREGWVFEEDGKLIGAVTLSDYEEGLNVIIHATINPEYHGRWLKKDEIYEVFTYCFCELMVERVTGMSVPGVSDDAGKLLLAFGFQKEGIMRNACRMNGRLHDVVLYGFLRDECRWIRRA